MAQDLHTQMLKGILQGCVLVILSRGEYYGYTLSQELEKYGFAEISKGTIYPLLMALEKKGLITSQLRPSPDGPARKYYQVTSDGMVARHDFVEEWHRLTQHVTQLLTVEEETGHEN
ncbi:PadR family transcriptional regulator [Lacticaseibacillus parahuelsenbergensis]|uniref:PadR family transcriptional regulator n=1 Tax=Lacticaseibacillus parahuelsenbergensis TaxID=3068305 RepID=A0ABY9L638_9LACO|nr:MULTISPECIES: PadR family transcriptional regulator [Lacticaseibacillus]MDE3282223.1 PadR family transcriptional regulator [Lacticaseibacillus casei]WLV79112.1 PadR family transcriptional regulator [Lacticaseibacillus sp. NCIMB 15471]